MRSAFRLLRLPISISRRRIYAKPATDEKVKDELDGMKSTVEAMVGFRWSDLLKNGPEMVRLLSSLFSKLTMVHRTAIELRSR